MAGTIVVDRIESDGSYASTINVASKVNFTGGMQVGGQDATFGGMRNRIINGDMRIDQRNAGAAVTITASTYTLDRWRIGSNLSGKVSIQQSSVAPSGFTNSLLVTSLSNNTPGTFDILAMQQNIEGLNCSDLGWGTANAKPITVSFWVRSSLTGTFGGSMLDAGVGGSTWTSYGFTYTINSANTWEYKTVTIPGPTSGVWPKDNSGGISLYFNIATGSAYSVAGGTWTTGITPARSASGVVNLASTNGATFYITGVQLEAGSVATPFEYRPYGTELTLCQRYFYRMNAQATVAQGFGHNQSTTQMRILFPTPVEMRGTPTFTSLGSLGLASGGTSFIASAASVLGASSNGIQVEFTVSGATQHQTSVYRDSQGVTFSAEL